MTQRSEQDLARTLRAAAGLAPEPVADLTVAVAARRRSRRRARVRTTLVVAGVAVAVGCGTVVAAGSFPFRGGEGGTVGVAVATPTPSEIPSTTPEGASMKVKPAAEVWPEAVFKMPAKAADGWRYRPVTALSPTEVLLFAESSFEKAGRLEVYDQTTKRFSVLAETPPTEGLKKYFIQEAEVDSRNIAYYATAQKPDGTPVAEFWVVPRSGGKPTLVTTIDGEQAADVVSVALAGDHLAWSLRKGGVYRVPLAGGDAEKVPGSDGLQVLSWPWAADARAIGDEPGPGNQSRLLNLETGERRSIENADGLKLLRCGPALCYGNRDGGRTPAGVVQGVDGADRRELPGLDGDGSPPIADRFVLFGGINAVEGGQDDPASAPVAVIYDRVTGTLGGIGFRTKDGSGGYGRGTSSSPSLIFYWGVDRLDKPAEYWVLNLAAVHSAE
ncbi:hypothetical protein [Sphaerisporangium fuscum]|uniref:hypothetical protein n=1 Tax=Sphaerisporangium fuscum TaxID=2835868 RepID=UPI001BDD0008|nr:hypothetical protein [Sphaerisporangium fuscum]